MVKRRIWVSIFTGKRKYIVKNTQERNFVKMVPTFRKFISLSNTFLSLSKRIKNPTCNRWSPWSKSERITSRLTPFMRAVSRLHSNAFAFTSVAIDTTFRCRAWEWGHTKFFNLICKNWNNLTYIQGPNKNLRFIWKFEIFIWKSFLDRYKFLFHLSLN